MAQFMRRTALAGLATVALGHRARGQTWPTRPVTMLIPYAAGGITDATGRMVARKLSDLLGQTVLVDNRPGAGGVIGTEAVARALPDGYTLGYGTQNTHTVAPFTHPTLRYDPVHDFVPVHGLGAAVNLLVVSPLRSYRTVRELIEFARQHPETVTYGSVGIATGQHMCAEHFSMVADVRMVHVPYQATPAALNDLTQGRIDIMFDYALTAMPQVREGRLRALSVHGHERLSIAPEVPTIAEAGLPGAEMFGWAGFFVPRGTPAPIAARLEAAIARVLADEELLAFFRRNGTVPWPDMRGADLGRWIEEELPRARVLVSRTGARSG